MDTPRPTITRAMIEAGERGQVDRMAEVVRLLLLGAKRLAERKGRKP